MQRHSLLFSLCLLLLSSFASANEENQTTPSLTYERYPYRFTSEKPLTPRSQLLLKFSQPVSPAGVTQYFQFHRKQDETFVGVKARRPSLDEVKLLSNHSRLTEVSDHWVLVEPATSLGVNGAWRLYGKRGLKDLNGSHQLTESKLDYLGKLEAFTIKQIDTNNPYDETFSLSIRHNKRALAPGFDAARLSEFISVTPRPENFQIAADSYQFRLTGDYDYGVDYTVTVKDGVIANDTIQLAQVYTETVRFQPNKGFITLPAFSTTQNAAGHRHFDIQTGNLTGIRTRVKQFEGDQLIFAIRDYDEKYEGWGEKQNLPFAHIAGETIYDQFSPSTAPIDKSETVTLKWDDLAGNATTGSYYLCTEGQSSTVNQHGVGAQALIQLTDIGMAWKQSNDETAIYTFSLRTGAPLSDAVIAIRDQNAKTLTSSTSNSQGVATLENAAFAKIEEGLFLDVVHQNDRHALKFYQDLNSVGLWNLSIYQRYDDLEPGERRTLLFTDRNVYRPGEEVKLKAISRFVDEEKLRGPGTGPATLTVFDSRNRKLVSREITFSENGTFDDQFTLPSAGLGWHRVEIDFNPPGSEDNRNWRLVTSHSFPVEEYRVNSFEIAIDAGNSYLPSDEITVPVSAKYYMGKPLSKAKLQWNLYSYRQFPSTPELDGFRFGDNTATTSSFSDEGETVLTPQGKASVSVKLPEQPLYPAPRRVSITTQITDANQQTISREANFTVDSSDFYLGIRKPEGVHRAGDTATFALAATQAVGGAHTSPVDVAVLVEKQIWTTVKVMGANGKMRHRNDRRFEMVSETQVNLTTQRDPETGLILSQAHPIRFAEAGDYLITLTSRDDAGRPVITRTEFSVIGAEEPAWSWYDVIRIDLTPDKSSYKPGEVAKLLVRSPVFGHALLTTELGKVRSTQSIEITDYETIVEVPIEAGDGPNLFASILIVRGSDDSPHRHTSADYRLGYCELAIDDPATHLEVTLDTGTDSYYQPGETVTVSAAIEDHLGKPVEAAEVTFFAVDEGVLSLTGHATPDPHAEFHRAFPLAVFTGQSLSNLLPENPLEQEFGNKGYVIGGGGAISGLDPNRIRKDFKALAFWEPSLKTDQNGKVTATFTAPDNLTTFRLMAIVAEGNRFAKAEKPIVINKPLIIEPALPGFTNLTDQIDLTAVLHNNTAEAQEVEITVQLDDHAVFLDKLGESLPTSLDASDHERGKTVTAILESGVTETLSFPAAMTAIGTGKWRWQVTSKSDSALKDATESTIEVGYPLPLLREAHSFTLEDTTPNADALKLIASRLRTGDGNVTLTLSNSRLVEAGDALDYLLRYPYGCVEQTTSSLIPWLSTEQLRKVMPPLEKSESEVAAITQKAIERLFSMQTADGGLGYWPGSARSELWGSAYAGVAIALAAQQGISIPADQATALWSYLSKNLRSTADLKDPYSLSQRCLSVYTLALAGAAEPAYHELLFERRQMLSAEGRCLLALAMVESNSGAPQQISELISPDAVTPVSEVSWYKQPYIAATRLLAQVKHNPNSERVDQFVTELLKLKGPQNGWGSTYSNAWPLIALAAYSESSAASLSATEVVVSFKGEETKISLSSEPESELVSFEFNGELDPNALVVTSRTGAPLYASLQVETYPALMPIEAENQGFSIERTYEKVEVDGSIAPAENLTIGDLVLITLDLNIPAARETYLAIDDPLPAILEAINPNFSSQATQSINKERNKRRLYANHHELRKDRAVFFVDTVYNAGDYSIQYLARVVAAGEVTAPPTKIEAMYEPQRFGLSGTKKIVATPLSHDSGKVASR